MASEKDIERDSTTTRRSWAQRGRSRAGRGGVDAGPPSAAAGAGRPRRRKSQRGGEILDAARRVFQLRGYDDASISEIARVAGCGEGTLYTYYRGKRAIFDAVLADFYDRLIAEIEPAFAAIASTRDRLAFLVARHIRIAIDEPAIGRMIIAETWGRRPYRGSKLHALNRRYSRFLMTALRDGVARGDLRDDLDLAMARDMVFGAVEHWVWNALTRREAVSPAQAAATMVGMFLDGWALAGATEVGASLEARVRRLERRVASERQMG